MLLPIQACTLTFVHNKWKISIRIFIAVLPIHSTLNSDLDNPTLLWLEDLHVLILTLELLDEHDVK